MSDDPTPDPAAAPNPAPDPAPDKTFTQADVDRIVQERVARVKNAPPDDYEALKAAATRLAEIEEADKTELEKERDRATQAEARATKIESEAKEIRIRSAILAEAAKPDRKVVDADTAVALLDRSTLELDDDGNPTNIAKAMDALLEAKPFLVAPAGGRGDADLGARNGGANQLTEAELKNMTPEEIVKARRDGRLSGLGVG